VAGLIRTVQETFSIATIPQFATSLLMR